MKRLHADLLLLGCAAVWGLAFLFQKSAMAHIGPLLFVAARGLAATAVLIPFVIIERRRLGAVPGSPVMALGGLTGLAFVGGAFLQQSGIKSASVMNTGFLTALYVVATPFISLLIAGRRVPSAVWGAVVLSCLGTWLLGGGTLGSFGRGDYLVAASALFWALQFVLTERAAGLERPVLFTTVQFLVVACIAGTAALLFEAVSVSGLRAALVDILYVGVLSSALTFTILALALRATSATEAAVIVSTDTLFAALGAWLLLDERLAGLGSTGAVLILVAVVVVRLVGTRRG